MKEPAGASRRVGKIEGKMLRMTIVVISTLVVGCSFDTSALNGLTGNDAGSPDLSVNDSGHEAAVHPDATSDTLQQDAVVQNDAQTDTIQEDAQPADSQVGDDASPADATPADTLPPPPCEGLVAVYANPGILQDCFGRHSDGSIIGLGKTARIGPYSGVCQISCTNGVVNDGGSVSVVPQSCEVQYPTPQTGLPGCPHLPADTGYFAGQAGCDYMARCAP